MGILAQRNVLSRKSCSASPNPQPNLNGTRAAPEQTEADFDRASLSSDVPSLLRGIIERRRPKIVRSRLVRARHQSLDTSDRPMQPSAVPQETLGRRAPPRSAQCGRSPLVVCWKRPFVFAAATPNDLRSSGRPDQFPPKLRIGLRTPHPSDLASGAEARWTVTIAAKRWDRRVGAMRHP